MYKTLMIALVASLVLVAPAIGQEMETRTHFVRSADLNLASAEGRTQLKQRIRTAARRVCSYGASTDRLTRSAESRCIKQAIDGTSQQVTLLLAAKGTDIALLGEKPNR